jgi:hypothetical protein
MTRTVRQINTKPGRSQDKGPRPFSDFGDTPCLVLLGDPGAGKTHVFTHAAKADGARFIKARAFLSLPASTLAGQPLFIDGLDEQRAGRSDRGIIDALVAKLFEVNPPKVRVSCRVADWLGDSDLAGLQPFFDQHGETAVLLLQSLDRAEQLAVLAAMGHQLGCSSPFQSVRDRPRSTRKPLKNRPFRVHGCSSRFVLIRSQPSDLLVFLLVSGEQTFTATFAIPNEGN